MKFGQLIEYNLKNIFLEKSQTKWGGETSSRPFSEKPKLSIYLWVNSLKVLFSLFILYVKLRAIEIYWNEAASHLLLPHIYKSFLKIKKSSGTSLSALFFALFCE